MAFSRARLIAKNARIIQNTARFAYAPSIRRSIASTSKCSARTRRTPTRHRKTEELLAESVGLNPGDLGSPAILPDGTEDWEGVFDRLIDKTFDKLEQEDIQYSVLAGKLDEALEALEREGSDPKVDSEQAPTISSTTEQPPAVNAAASLSSESTGEDGDMTEGTEEANPAASTMKELETIHSTMTPAERVIDLLDRLAVAGQPLLQRIIDSEGKDLDHLLSEMEADEALEEKLGSQTGEEEAISLPRDRVLNPNSLAWDKALRRSAMSPTRAIMRDRKRTLYLSEEEENALKQAGLSRDDLASMQEEAEFDLEDEQRAREELTQWIESAAEAGKRVGLDRKMLTESERKHMAQLLEAATKDDSLLLRQVELEEQEGSAGAAISSPTTTESPDDLGVPLDMEKLESLARPKHSEEIGEKWFTTIPSIGLDALKTVPRTHSIPVASLHFRSYFSHLVDLQTRVVVHSAYGLGIPVSKPVPLPTQRTLITVLRSPFIHKKSQENWERKTHKRAIKVWDCNPELLTGWLAWLERNGIAGVGMRVTRWEYVGLDMLENGSTAHLHQEVNEFDVPEEPSDTSSTLHSKIDLGAVEPSAPEVAQDVPR